MANYKFQCDSAPIRDSAILQTIAKRPKKRRARGGIKRRHRSYEKFRRLVNRNCNGVQFEWPLSGGTNGEKREVIKWMKRFKLKVQNASPKSVPRNARQTDSYKKLKHYLKKELKGKLDLVSPPMEDCLFETFYRLDKHLFNGYFWKFYEQTGQLFDIGYQDDLITSMGAVGCTKHQASSVQIRIQGGRYKEKRYKKMLLSTIAHEAIHALLIHMDKEDSKNEHGRRWKMFSHQINLKSNLKITEKFDLSVFPTL